MSQADLPAIAKPVALQPAVGVASPMELLRLAIVQGVPVESLERLQAMAERAADRAAAQEFAEALAAFQCEVPDVPKSRTATVPTKSGGTYSYRFANLDDIVRTVGPALAKHGLSYTFDSLMDEKGMVEVCTIRHVGGHAVQSRSPVVTMEASTPGLSPQQRVGNAQTYARRYALTGALGITTGDEDNDAAPGRGKVAGGDDPITEQQLAELTQEINSRDVDLRRFCDFLGVFDIGDLSQKDVPRALAALQRKPRRS